MLDFEHDPQCRKDMKDWMQEKDTEWLKEYIEVCRSFEKMYGSKDSRVARLNRWELKIVETEVFFRELGL